MVLGIPSFDTILVNLTTLVAHGPLGAMAAGANGIDRAAMALHTALGDQSPESIAARNRVKDLTDNEFVGEFHEQRIPDALFENTRRDGLAELYRKAQAIDVGAVSDLQGMWKSRAEKLEQGLNQFGPEILSAIAEKWEGAAAQSAAQGIVDYVNKARNMVTATKIVAEKVEIVKSAVEVTKANVQPPPTTGWASTLTSWMPGPTWKMDRDRTDAAELATHTVLERVYQPGIKEGDTGQPRIPLAYNPVQDSSGAPYVPGGGGSPSVGAPAPVSSGAGSQGSSGSPGSSEQPGVAEPPSGDAGTQPSSAGDQQASQGKASDSTSTAGLGDSQPTTPASAGSSGQPSGAGTGGSGAGTPAGGWHGGSGTPRSSAGSGGSGAGGTGAPGRSVAGTPGGAALGANAASGSGASGSTGRAGTSGMGGMSPGAGRGKGDEDKEKGKSAVAEALVNRTNGAELTGMDPEHRRPTVPPVLGE
ncbi:hypothetical protein [Nocardia bovistercoris]|uniref:PPE domain-containing protein n=1 Tax=Nocardia bovistercoris TaxID=2785916 RepID=A0A931N544_9NOCA|nr:hypothetical protein [Nocardia bovistercoris]MBH0778268.1 hypothetical protein [Nocardia bovistercoris]